MEYFENKWVWITGASHGIGKEFALQLHQMGAHLIISSRKRADLEIVKNLCSGAAEVKILPLDLAKHEELPEIISNARLLLEKVDILINNAGISQRSMARNSQFEIYQELMAVNYLGPVMISLHMLRIFEARGHGHFATISSVAGLYPVPLRSGYCASKMAIKGFFESIRAENDNDKIHITMLYPAFVNTDISKHALTGDGTSTGVMDDAQANAMSPEAAVQQMLTAISNKKPWFTLGGFRETILAPFIHKVFPALFIRILKKAKVT